MLKKSHEIILLVLVLLILLQFSHQDKPCAARSIAGESVVCVCNTTYCDEITRDVPGKNFFKSYTTSKDGLRFYKDSGIFQQAVEYTNPTTTLELDVTKYYQLIEGFGGAVTGAAGINWKNLQNPRLKQFLINSYFSKDGIEYNMMRLPIGGSDFSASKIAYNVFPENDKMLSNYTLDSEDYNYKIPMIKAAKAVATSTIEIVASCWSPPDWMKDPNEYAICGTLKPEYYQTYANYHLKFIDLYAKQGIWIWAVTSNNEPDNYIFSDIPFNCVQWSMANLVKFIASFLGPTIKNSKYKTLILGLDDMRFTLPFFASEIKDHNPGALKYLDGFALHAYFDDIFDPNILKQVTVPYPDKIVLMTEFCEGFRKTDTHVILGSWDRAASYAQRIIQNLNHGARGFIDWNLCLDKNGGPNWSLNFVDSPIIVFPELKEFVKQPTFYIMGHFSKFVPRGSRRIDVEVTTSISGVDIQSVAFVTPRRTVVVVLFNPTSEATVCLKLGSMSAIINSPADSIVTVEMLYEK